MLVRSYFPYLLAPLAWLAFFSVTTISSTGCYFGGSYEKCDDHGNNCEVCDSTGCHPARPSVDTGAGGGGGGVETPPCDPQVTTCGCKDNSDCPLGMYCLDGLCLDGCNNSYECGGGKVCVDGKCEIVCNETKPCNGGYICENNHCALDPVNVQCTDSNQCAEAGRICVNGLCQLPCSTHANCPEGQLCDATTSSCFDNPNPTPTCGPLNPCPDTSKCGADGYCHFTCSTLEQCKLIDNRFYACDQNICKTQEEADPQCSLTKPCPVGKQCVSNKCL